MTEVFSGKTRTYKKQSPDGVVIRPDAFHSKKPLKQEWVYTWQPFALLFVISVAATAGLSAVLIHAEYYVTP